MFPRLKPLRVFWRIVCVIVVSRACWKHAGRPGAPHAQTAWLEAELPWPVCGLVLDLVDANGVFENHAVRPFEIQEACAGAIPAGQAPSTPPPVCATALAKSGEINRGWDSFGVWTCTLKNRNLLRLRAGQGRPKTSLRKLL